MFFMFPLFFSSSLLLYKKRTNSFQIRPFPVGVTFTFLCHMGQFVLIEQLDCRNQILGFSLKNGNPFDF